LPFYEGPERPSSEVGRVAFADCSVREIDGKFVRTFFRPAYHLLPGEHTIVVRLDRNKPDGKPDDGPGPDNEASSLSKNEMRFTFTVKAGYRYNIYKGGVVELPKPAWNKK
jgi:hypothetical protein